MSAPQWTIELPEPWQTAPFRPGFVKVIGEAKLPRGRQAILVLGLLKDSTNVLALKWDRGMRLARVSPDTDWAVEEHFSGRPPQRDERIIVETWRVGIKALVKSGHDARAEMATPGWKPTPAVAVLSHPEALDRAYNRYCEDVNTPMSREQFELQVEVLARRELEGGASA